MALIRTSPNQYNAEDAAYSTSTAAETGHLLGFQANQLHVYNDKTVPVYVALNSTDWSTGGHRTCAGESLVVRDVLITGYSIAASGTSTAGQVRTLAVGA